ncbi:MAG: FliM/FliN family flagellar motor switch protein [Thermoleophilaceae bacterium]|nr:FliM/FliN family flagellar motor switch protein [Thermoleophilaceae bacterium]
MSERAHAAELSAQLRDVDLRFWAELGRARLPVRDAASLEAGSIVDLDRRPDDPVELYVNGLRFGTGRLQLVDGEWAVRIEEILVGGDEVRSVAG